jgi:hypothetical protein
VDTKKRQKTKVKGSIVFNPIFIMGNDVPHRTPAKIVKKTALLLVLNSELGNRFSSPPLRQATKIKRFCCFFEIIMAKKIKEISLKRDRDGLFHY